MKRGVVFLFCLLISLPVGATSGATRGATSGSMSEAHEVGKAFSGQKQTDGLQGIQGGQEVVPTFDGNPLRGIEIQGNPLQGGQSASDLYESSDLSAATAAAKSEARSFIEESKASRQHYTFDTQTDPLFMRSEGVMEEQALRARKETESEIFVSDELTAKAGTEKSDTHDCIESTQPNEASCTSTLMIDAHLQRGGSTYEKRCAQRYCREECWGNWKRKCRHVCDCVKWEEILVSHEPDQVIVTEEKWIDSCPHLEQLSDAGLCAYVSKVCTQGPETRTINGASLHRDCWQYTSTYACEHPQKDGCKDLRERGCFQVGSSCHEQRAQGCVSYKQTYRCEDLSRTIKGKRGKNNLGLFCADGSCADTSYTANKDMLESISKLQILKEMGKDMAGEPLSLFKGSDQRCSKSCLSFSDCCGLSGGWGETVKMTQCSGEEKDLGERRKKGLCQLVGTYCAEKEKITGICLKKKTSYCCFSSKLARLFQTQGRAQLGMGWGSGENPNCRGFTVEELTKIDFSKLDTREIFSEISARYKPGNQAPDLQTKTLHSIETNMKQMGTGAKGTSGKEGLNGKGL